MSEERNACAQYRSERVARTYRCGDQNNTIYIQVVVRGDKNQRPAHAFPCQVKRDARIPAPKKARHSLDVINKRLGTRPTAPRWTGPETTLIVCESSNALARPNFSRLLPGIAIVPKAMNAEYDGLW